ncbi:MAG: hypothetical protein L6309_01835 [Candidatus Omnitrophica bacterium]|nr:hypothetical protein [Candidatus Omnitrophota bacterium]
MKYAHVPTEFMKEDVKKLEALNFEKNENFLKEKCRFERIYKDILCLYIYSEMRYNTLGVENYRLLI